VSENLEFYADSDLKEKLRKNAPKRDNPEKLFSPKYREY
jgi:hypothetical protein